ncbi:hypothetical protein AX14_007557 [Amanita brunnescens Koide BX004]|nr:hypothetical protein AX14_007557 [Amanita brunnescens Koide BX004]
MSYLQLSYFSNHDRPPIQHPEITSLPVDILGPAIAAKVDESLRVSTSDMPACAASARLWEDLLEQHRIPYLLVRVADMRWALDNKFTALVLYEELHAALQHTDLGKWIITAQSSAIAEAERQLHNYLHDTSLGFTASQRWRPTAGSDVFPYFKLQRIQINAIRNEWMNMESPETIMEKFLNLHCLETNVMEGTVQFDESVRRLRTISCDLFICVYDRLVPNLSKLASSTKWNLSMKEVSQVEQYDHGLMHCPFFGILITL